MTKATIIKQITSLQQVQAEEPFNEVKIIGGIAHFNFSYGWITFDGEQVEVSSSNGSFSMGIGLDTIESIKPYSLRSTDRLNIEIIIKD